MTSKFLIDVDVAEEVQYSLIHDTFLLNPGERLNLVDFMVDYNTELNYWIHPIAGSAGIVYPIRYSIKWRFTNLWNET